MSAVPPRPSRPLRTALLFGLAAGVLAVCFGAWLLGQVIARSSSSTAVLGWFALPQVAVRLGAPAAVVGAAVGLLLSDLWTGRPFRPARMVIAAATVIGLGGWGASLLLPRLIVRPEVRRVSGLAEPDLRRVLDHPSWGQNVYVLAAVASNPRASSETLARIAARADPRLHVLPGTSLLDVLVTESRDEGRPVMYLVARNANTPASSIDALAGSPEPQVLAEVARNPKLSAALLVRLVDSSDVAIRRGVAANPGASPEILDRLSRDSDSVIRLGVAWNRRTPPEVRERLQSDPDQYVRDAAIRGFRADATNTPLLIR
jgi:hypothetical protein